MKSRYFTRQELQQKGVDQELIINHFDEYYEKAQERKNLEQDLRKKWLRLKTMEEEKILARYYRQGYSLEEVLAIIEELRKS